MRRHHPVAADTITLSFLDVLSCGMGAMIFMLLLLGTGARQNLGRANKSPVPTGLVAHASRGAAQGRLAGRLMEIDVELSGVPSGSHGACWSNVNCPGDSSSRQGAALFAYSIGTDEKGVSHELLVLPQGLRPSSMVRLNLLGDQRSFRVQVSCAGIVWPTAGGWAEYSESRQQQGAWALTGEGRVLAQAARAGSDFEPGVCR